MAMGFHETMNKLEEMCLRDDNVMEVLSEMAEKLTLVNETEKGDRVLDINVTYKNYKTNTKNEYSKRFKKECVEEN